MTKTNIIHLKQDTKTAAIVLNGLQLSVKIFEDFIICADGGYNLVHPQIPNVIIGDLDSIADISKIHTSCKVVKFPDEKNETDGELAILYAKEQGITDISIYGALDGRIDHVLGNIALLSYAKKLNLNAKICDKDLTLYLFSDDFTLDTGIGDIVSILPNGKSVEVEYCHGLYYGKGGFVSTNDNTIGLSNKATDSEIFVKIKSGEALVFHYATSPIIKKL